MSLSVHTTSNDGVVVVALAGAVDATLLTPLRDALAEARLLVIDLDEVTDLDAAALRAVIVALLDGARGGRLCIAATDTDLRARLAGASVHHVVAVHHTVAEATGATIGEH